MIAPTGEGFMFNQEDHPEISPEGLPRMYAGKLKKLSVPFIGGLPSDKVLKYTRSGNNLDYSDPKPEWLPINFNETKHPHRAGY